MVTLPCPRRGVYLITRESADTAALTATVAAALRAGTVMVQYRDKRADPALRLEQARALVALCTAHAVPLIVNDDIDLAATVGAQGVHLGRDDAAIAVARARLGPSAVIGASCYDDMVRAHQACAAGADYLAFGSFFASPTKPTTVRATPALLSQAGAMGLPRVAIGGITLDNAQSLIAAGADMLATVSAVFDAPDPGAATRTLVSFF
jgi:thiamine-phosphate pyrophosphorylase